MLRVFIFLLLLVPISGHSQSAGCKQYVLNAYEQFNRRYDFTGKSPSAHLKMRVETTYQQSSTSKLRSTIQQIEAERQGDYLYFTDGTTAAYQSPGELVTIMRDKKMVVITNAVMPKQSEYAPGMQLMRTSIIQNALLESCTTLSENGRSYRRIVLIPQKMPKLAAIRKMVVLIDDKSLAIFRFAIVYNGSQPVSQTTYTLLEEAPTSKAKRLKPAFEYVLAHDNSLRPEFAGFQLLDQRKR